MNGENEESILGEFLYFSLFNADENLEIKQNCSHLTIYS